MRSSGRTSSLSTERRTSSTTCPGKRERHRHAQPQSTGSLGDRVDVPGLGSGSEVRPGSGEHGDAAGLTLGIGPHLALLINSAWTQPPWLAD